MPEKRIIKLVVGASSLEALRERQTRREAGTQSQGPLLVRGSPVTEQEGAKRMRLRIPSVKGYVRKAYERLLRLPVPLVLAVLWLVGVALVSLCLLALFML